MTISVLLFGLAKTLWLAIASRALGGLLGGNAMLINSAVGDITDETNQAQAYALVGLAFNAATVIAPLLGLVQSIRCRFHETESLNFSGAFAEPEFTFPGSLGRIRFLREFPYFLPCAISALFVFVSFVVGLLFMKEVSIDDLSRILKLT